MSAQVLHRLPLDHKPIAVDFKVNGIYINRAILKIYIKYMVSHCCKLIVKNELSRLELEVVEIRLGEVVLAKKIPEPKLQLLKLELLKSGLEVMDDKNAVLIETIKNVIIEIVHNTKAPPPVKFSIYLAQKLEYDYTYLSNLFSEVAGVTIEHFYILHRIERAKELIIYNELNLSEIATCLHYSSLAHLSNQFKKVTGLSPSFFKSLKSKKRIALENVGMM